MDRRESSCLFMPLVLYYHYKAVYVQREELPMTVEVESLAPKTGQLTIDIQLSATVNVTAFSARQKVTGFVADEISTNMHGGEPSLAVGERICWRVPVILSMPPTGDRGQVGTIDVDVETGQLLVSRSLIEEIKQRAEHLASHNSLPPT